MDDASADSSASPPPLRPDTMRRLALIRSLYLDGLARSEQPEPGGALSILQLHDAVELFLALAAEHVNSGRTGLGFMEYWEALSPRVTLTQKEAIRRLNESRIGLKHHGLLPSRFDMESLRASVTSFFEENTPLAFGVSFSEISLLELVPPGLARDYLEEADRAAAAGDFRGALFCLSYAFGVMMLSGSAGGEYPSFAERPEGIDQESYLGKLAEAIFDAISGIEEAVNLVGLGIDYRRYRAFRRRAPAFNLGHPGMHREVFVPLESPSEGGYRACREFVLESALVLESLPGLQPIESEGSGEPPMSCPAASGELAGRCLRPFLSLLLPAGAVDGLPE